MSSCSDIFYDISKKTLKASIYSHFHYTHVITFTKTSIKINLAIDEGNSRNEIWHWKKDEIGVAVQSLIAQSVRASERSSVAVDSNPT